jgi:phage major head subunit gpT-like protein
MFKIEFRKMAALFAVLAVVLALVALTIPHDAVAAFTGHGHLISTASIALIAMRSEHADLIAKATAKFGEIKADLAADVVARIETEHAALITKATAKAAEIAAEETRIAAEATAALTVKPWAAVFYATSGALNIPLKKLNEIVAAATTHESAKDALIVAMAADTNANLPNATGVRATITAEGTEKFITGATRSLIGKVSMFNRGKPSPDGERNEFSGLSLRELARMSLEMRGIRLASHDPMAMIGQAMGSVVMAGQLSTSDFVNILANVANKAMLKGYEEAAENFNIWTGVGTLTDFKTAKRVDLGLFPSLAVVDEGAEYSYATMSDRGVNLVLATYGKIFSITRQAIINDDLNAFTKVPAKMGNASKRTIGNLVYALLIANPNAPDGTALFHANHKNLATGAGTVLAAGSLDAGRAAMGKQTDPDNVKQGLNIRPAYLLTPIALQGTANQVINSQSEPGQNNAAVANRVQGMAQVVPESRLDVNSTTAFYLAADPATTDTIEVDYLNGVQTPTLEQRDGWGVDGVEMKVRMDAGVTLLDHRGLYKSLGNG